MPQWREIHDAGSGEGIKGSDAIGGFVVPKDIVNCLEKVWMVEIVNESTSEV